MELFSFLYLLLIVLLAICYYAVPRICKAAARYQWTILLAGSLLFYLIQGQVHILFLMVTAATVYGGGILLSNLDLQYRQKKKEAPDRASRARWKAATLRKKRIVLILVMAVNFGILAWFKYFRVLLHAKSIFLPIGISFYTFQAVGYLIDQYGGKYPPERNFARFLLFVSWFPQMLQGPIGRYDRLSASLYAPHAFDRERTERALLLMLFGLVKKYTVADMLNPAIAAIFDSGDMADRPGCMVVFGILLYSVWQYADFSGGIDIIRGISALFGVELDQNFRQPYFSVSLGDFWRRWHITLGTWMRDYVFYPLALTRGMQKLGKWCTRHFGRHAGRTIPAGIANIAVFFLVGLWHGAQSHYLLWGLYNGIVIALSDLTAPFWQSLAGKLRMNTASRGFSVFRILRTFVIVNIGWYFDRIYDFHDCMLAFCQTFTAFDGAHFGFHFRNIILEELGGVTNTLGSFGLALIGTGMILAVSLQKERGIDCEGRLLKRAAGWTYAFSGLCLLLVFASFVFTTTAGGFLYANF